jgi:hypothetical protein
VLVDAGLVARESAGTATCTAPTPTGVASMRGFFDSLWDVGLAASNRPPKAVARSHLKETS